MTGDLLELAQWALDGLKGSADYVQVFAERTLQVRVECLDGEVLATCVEPREGIGCMVRQGDRWRQRSLAPAELGGLPGWLDPAAGASGERPAWPGPGVPDFTPIPAGEWLVPDAGTAHSLRTMEDFTARAVAVVDTDGVRAASADRVVRRRMEATVVVDGARYRGLNRWLERGPADPDRTAAHTESRVALSHAVDSSRAAVTGRYRTPVVFGPSAACGFLHELVGHALEGDNFAMRSDYITGLRKPGAVPAMLTVRDDATLPDGYGSYAIDDEGVAGGVTTLLANGELGAPITSVRAAQRHGYTPTGNGRRTDYRELALPRASNTVVPPGTEDPAALLHGAGTGVLYVGCLGAGMINLATGEFSFAALNCVYITPDGHRVPARDVSLVGDALETLARMEGIGSDFGGDSITCGKQNQMVGIGLFSPSIRYSALDWSAA
ncbi:TldD/PmbA family protein [Kitasatospora xanthocidica]|uniref:TldD/PmbA family protein n=1 Tax=Kitasatospora xanthocidica TaxID=83382 RepID=UPI0036E05D5A